MTFTKGRIYLLHPWATFGLSRLLSSLWVSRTGRASDWCAPQEALYKCIDTIQYNLVHLGVSSYNLSMNQFLL